jgi:hypothetical protein
MSTFSDLPRYPADSTDGPHSPPDSEDAIRHAGTILKVAAELLLIASPLVGGLWLLFSFPILIVVIVVALERDNSD